MLNINELKELLPFCKLINVLFVEDNDIVREQTIKMLKKVFPNIDTANNGKEAIEIYESFTLKNNSFYDIVISDLSMPILNGSDLCKMILEKNPSQSIIILSAHTESEEFLELEKLSIKGFVQKPIDQTALLTKLISVIKELKSN
ncbi:response regulator [Poseidonibacter lekithochrous]|uniref:response regulator n=1 Tax=Poseidonibacter lekithochrous TaxID=1904463 RepID=UPI0008FCD3A8|nr:response regulator [Poseidonibacter lekithochrous]QKJ23544.1 two-component system response regulator [Poseidonibacter lekithochrous]